MESLQASVRESLSVRPYFVFAVVCMSALTLWELYLNYRQYCSTYCEEPPEVPHYSSHTSKELVTAYKEIDSDDQLLSKLHSEHLKSCLYSRSLLRFRMVRQLYSFGTELLVLFFSVLPFLWSLSRRCSAFLGFASSETVASLVFITLYQLLSDLLSLPFEFYHHFVIEERFGMNKRTLRIFLTDHAKNVAISLLIYFIVVPILLLLIRWTGSSFWIYSSLFIGLFIVLMQWIYPSFIAPWFNTFTPLESGELRSSIEALSASVHFPLKEVYIVDGSTRSSHSNAYFTGIGSNKRIVLFDTLVQKSTKEEIVAVLGHELGHWALNHLLLQIGLMLLLMVALLRCFAFFLGNSLFYQSFGFREHWLFIGLVLFMDYVWTPMQFIFNLLFCFVSRAMESQADAFSVKIADASQLVKGLIRLSVDNLSNTNPDWLYSLFNYSHPPLIERIRGINALKTA